MPDDLRARIAAVLVEVLKSDPEGFANEYEPCDDDGNPCGATLLRIDSVLDPQALADAVIRELKLHVVLVGDFRTVIKGSYPKPLKENDD